MHLAASMTTRTRTRTRTRKSNSLGTRLACGGRSRAGANECTRWIAHACPSKHALLRRPHSASLRRAPSTRACISPDPTTEMDEACPPRAQGRRTVQLFCVCGVCFVGAVCVVIFLGHPSPSARRKWWGPIPPKIENKVKNKIAFGVDSDRRAAILQPSSPCSSCCHRSEPTRAHGAHAVVMG